jgi:hypothetical protein
VLSIRVITAVDCPPARIAGVPFTLLPEEVATSLFMHGDECAIEGPPLQAGQLARLIYGIGRWPTVEETEAALGGIVPTLLIDGDRVGGARYLGIRWHTGGPWPAVGRGANRFTRGPTRPLRVKRGIP